MSRPVPFAKRFPGRHAISALLVLPSGSRIEIAGPFPGEVAELVRALLCGDTTGDAVRSAMSTLQSELDSVSRKAVAASQQEAAGG